MSRPKILAAVELNAVTWTRVWIKFPVQSVALQCRTAVNLIVALSGNPGEAYWTIKSGRSLEMDLDGFTPSGFIYAKAASGTPVLEIFTLV